MKPKVYLILFLCVLFNYSYAQKKTVIAGKIENFKKSHLTFSFYHRGILSFDDHTEEVKIPVRKDGTFIFKTEEIKDFVYKLHTGFNGTKPIPMSLLPGDSIYVTFDAKQFEKTITFSGKGTAKNVYLAKHYNQINGEDHMASYLSAQSQGAQVFYEWLSKQRQIKIDLLKKLKSQGIEDEFYITERSNLDLHYYKALLNYADTMQTIPAEYKKAFKTIDITEENIFKNRREDFLKNYLSFYAQNVDEDLFNTTKDLLKGINRDYYIGKIIYASIRKGDLLKSGNYLKDFSTFCSNPVYLTFLNSEYERISKIHAGFQDGSLYKRAKDSVTITGLIRNYEFYKTGKTVSVSYQDFNLPGKSSFQSTINSDGTFLLRFPKTHDQEISFASDDVIPFSIICSPGTHLYIEVDPGESMRTNVNLLLGDLADENKVFQELNIFKLSNSKLFYTSLSDMKKLQPEAYKVMRLGKYMEQQKLITQFFEKRNYTGLIKEYTNYDLMYSCASDLISYPQRKKMDTKSKLNISLPANYYDFQDKFPLNNDRALYTPNYMSYMKESLRILRQRQLELVKTDPLPTKSLGKLSPQEDAVLKKLAASTIMHLTREERQIHSTIRIRVAVAELTNTLINDWNGSALDWALYEVFNNELDAKRISSVRDNIEKFKIHEKNMLWRQDIIAKYEELEANYNNPIMNAEVILNVSQKNAEDILEELNEKHSGKLIYIDIWATWCKPCLARMPLSKQLHEKYKDKVSFVYFCIKSAEPIWKATLAKVQQPGDHYFLNQNQTDYLTKKFNIGPIPHYILMDQNGVIVNDKAQDPGWNGIINQDLVKEFDRLIIEKVVK